MFSFLCHFHFQTLSESMTQNYYDLITRESEKFLHLNNMLSVDLEQKKREKRLRDIHDQNDKAAENERMRKIQFDEEIKKEREEKKLLLQAIINEAESSGCPLPPSLIRLLGSHNGKKN